MRNAGLCLSCYILYCALCTCSLGADGIWKRYLAPDHLSSIAIDGEDIWCSTESGITKWNRHDSTYVKLTLRDINEHVNVGKVYGDIVVDYEGSLVVRGEKLLKFDGNKWYSNYRGASADISLQTDGIIWNSGVNGSVCKYDKELHATCYNNDFPFSTKYLAVDRNNVVWMALINTPLTDGDSLGVMRYDGENFTHYTIDDGLPDSLVTEVYVDLENVVWFGAKNGIASFDGDVWKTYMNPGMLQNRDVLDMAMDGNGVMWISLFDGIVSFDGNAWADHTPPYAFTGDYCNEFLDAYLDIEIDNDNVLWCASGKGLLRYDGVSWSIWKENGGPNAGSVKTAYVDAMNRKWFYCEWYKRGLSCFDGETWSQFYSEKDAFELSEINQLKDDPSGFLWLSGNPVYRYVGDTWIPSEGIGYFLEIDKENIVWAGGHFGVYRYDGSSWELFSTNDVLQGKGVDCAVVDSTNVKWFGTPDGLARYDGENWSFLKERDGLVFDNIDIMTVDKNNILWAANLGHDKIMSFDGISWTDHTKLDAPSYNLYCMTVDNDNTLWVGTLSGVWSYDGESWKHHTENNAPSVRVETIVIDHNNVMWCTVKDIGIASYDGQTWNQYGYEHGLHKDVFCIAVDHDNVKWFGDWYGVVSFDDSAVTGVDKNDSTPEALSVLHTYPNPFNPSTTIEFTLPESGFATLSIYNISGQKVRELAADHMTAGMHSLVWDGRDDNLNAVSSGIYITRLEAGKQVAAGRMVLMK